MNFKNLFIGFSLIALLFSCSSDSSDDLTQNPDPDPDPEPTAKITYDDDIKTIMTNNCTSCHSSPPQGAPFSLTTYTQVKNRVDGIISRINNASSPMPPSGLMPQNLRDMVQQWKDDGLLEN